MRYTKNSQNNDQFNLEKKNKFYVPKLGISIRKFRIPSIGLLIKINLNLKLYYLDLIQRYVKQLRIQKIM